MRQMGSGWLSEQDLRKIGAGQWKVLQFAIPDLVKDDLIDQIQLTRKNGRSYSRYKINSAGERLLEAVEQHVQAEYDKAVDRIAAFREQHGIRKPSW
jgi:DNA-binding PadR family transcriptional regulator